MADRLGLPVPKRIALGPDAQVRARVTLRGTELLVGFPAVRVLDRAELAVLIAHELAGVAAAPGLLANARYRAWSRAMDAVAPYDDDEQPPRVAAALVRRLRARDAPVEVSTAAAFAFVRLSRADGDFLEYSSMLEDALTRFGGLRYRITDLHEAWPAAVDDEPVDPDEAAEVARRHPSLAAVAAEIAGRPMPPADPVPLEPLSRRRQRQLSAQVLSTTGRVPWRTLAAVPPKFWQRAAAREVRPLQQAIAHVLGRPAHDPGEAADVIRVRPAEVAACPPEDLETAVFQAHAWLVLADATLLAGDAGWIRAHPAVTGVLVDAAGSRLDLPELTAKATTDPFAYARLRSLLVR
ncbi:hypothetical protein OWR29_15605 [Actinoplanes sp. Pm04-4]|uniref:Uncharacterized protein n=1 Tax=Paractinoplanes pyxinae TaxID=2997416 RepID=A0ABT4AYZ5_9ACTN|nr:hypothetical protein [Actinoplanes pyxinae]MCY1139424.1 hypothetical protein [Actinoplanes pyxinae]